MDRRLGARVPYETGTAGTLAADHESFDTNPGPGFLPLELLTVAANCDICGKGPGFGNSISHSHRRTPRRWNPNIQSIRTRVGSTPKRQNVCTSCIKAGKVTR